MNNTGKEVETTIKNKREVLGLKNTVTEMNNEIGRLAKERIR